jgi:hypothetical protein
MAFRVFGGAQYPMSHTYGVVPEPEDSIHRGPPRAIPRVKHAVVDERRSTSAATLRKRCWANENDIELTHSRKRR